MRPRFALLVLFAVCAPLAACGSDAPPLDRGALRAEWEAWRSTRDSLYASGDSPIPEETRAGFEGLDYFAYDSTLVVSASLQPSLQPDTLYLGTSTGEPRAMVASGVLVFRSADGQPQRLAAYLPLGDPAAQLFVPFRDQTTGVETYGGGRYMDLSPAPDGRIALDFNRAYHPTCVVNPSFSCPIPPPQNTLRFAVTAGERFPEASGEGV